MGLVPAKLLPRYHSHICQLLHPSAYNTPVTHPSLAGSLSEVACDASLIQFLI